MVKIDVQLRNQIVAFMETGYSQSNVARQLNLGQTTVRKIWLRYTATGSTENRPKSGRPMKTTERERRRLCQLSKTNPFKTPRELMNEVRFSQDVSIYTVRRVLNKSGLYARSAAKKPLLDKRNVKKRINFCRSYRSFSMEQWRNVVFTDECQVKMFSTRRTIVRRPVGCRFINRYVTKTVKFGGASVLVWGAIKGDGSRLLIKCPKRLDSIKYQSILEEGLPNIYDTTNIFMHDGAPCHQSKSTRQYFDNKGVCLLSDWPPQSPDINIIENLWALLKYRVSKHFTKSTEELWNILKTEWYAIDNDTISKLYNSIPGRINEIYSKKGQQSHY